MFPNKQWYGRELKWFQPRVMRRHFQLKDGDTPVATLDFASAFGGAATMTSVEGSWTFKRVGFWKPRVIVQNERRQEVAVFRQSAWCSGGVLDLSGGRSYRAKASLWGTSYLIANEGEEPLVQMTRIRGAFHVSSKVQIHPAGARLAELPWLVGLGWFLALKMQDDAAGRECRGGGGVIQSTRCRAIPGNHRLQNST